MSRLAIERLEDRVLLATFLVNSVLDEPDSNTADALCDDGAGNCTLRGAIQQANATGNVGGVPDEIHFSISGSGVHTITPGATNGVSTGLGALPAISDPVIIDGYTQPGASPNTLAIGDNAVLLVELNGANAGAGAAGLAIGGVGGSTVRGLAINRFGGVGIQFGIQFRGAGSQNHLEGNFIGLDPAGNTALGNSVGLNIASPNNTIGGTTASARNVISGNQTNGINLDDGIGGNTIQGNYIGTNAAGTLALGNQNTGVSISQGTGNTIGGTIPGAGNLISGNGGDGIAIGTVSRVTNGHVIQGNFIGTDASGIFPLGNGEDGIFLRGLNPPTFGNTIGGLGAGAGNLIAFNGRFGIGVFDGTGHAILSNSIHSNSGLGIAFSSNGIPTPNDPGDGDVGFNNLQNFPVLTAASLSTTSTTITGTLNSTPNTTFTLQFFANAADDPSGFEDDPSGFGEGQTFLGSAPAPVMTNANGDVSFSVTLPTPLPSGQSFLTATATDPSNNTSEFSADFATVSPVFTVLNTADSGAGSLRQAILNANDHPNFGGPDPIVFSIPGAGVHTISPTSFLPPITDPVVIDGYTQPGASPNTLRVGDDAVLLIEIDGTGVVAGSFNGLELNAGNSTVRGLVINRFVNSGILLRTGGNVVEGNFIGTDPSGSIDRGNASSGVFSAQGAGNLVGGTTPAARNILSGNDESGVAVGSGSRFASAPGTLVRGNYIGTDASGTVAIRNGFGVGIGVGGDNAVIGGNDADDGVLDGVIGARNVISGNMQAGIGIDTSGNGLLGSVTIQGNFIGVNAAGSAALGNLTNGIINDGRNRFGTTLIGGIEPGAGNVISANNGLGMFDSAAGTVIQGNLIGTDVTGTIDLGNTTHGIETSAATIGGATPTARNVISGNNGDGINLAAFNVASLIQGNLIGTMIDGVSPLGNSGRGIAVSSTSGVNIIIGGEAAGEGNTIAHNGQFGVIVGHPNARATILGNSIFANGGLGIDLADFEGANVVNQNDPGDADVGANDRQNFPVLNDVVSTAVDSSVFGSLDSTPQTDFLIQFFASEMPDPSFHGEGQTFLGETVVHTNSAGIASIAARLPVRVPPGQNVTATASRLTGSPAVPEATSEFSRAINEATSVLQLGQMIELDLALGQELRFRLTVPPGTDARLSAGFSESQLGQILIGHSGVPDVNAFDENVFAFVNQSPEFLLSGSPAPYLIVLRGTSVAAIPSVLTVRVSLLAETVGLEFVSVGPARGSNAGQVTTTIFGAGFTPTTVFSLVAEDGTARPAASVLSQDSTTQFATFELAGLAPGLYDVRAVDGPRSALLTDAFTVTTGIVGQFVARVHAPDVLLKFREGRLLIEYANTGETDIPAPLVAVHAVDARLTRPVNPPSFAISGGGGGGGGGGGNTFLVIPPPFPPPPPPPQEPVAQFLAISRRGPAGVLPPGAYETVEISFQDDGSARPDFHPELSFTLVVTGAEQADLPFDLGQAKEELRPAGVEPEAWDIMFNNLVARLGGTSDGVVPVGSYLAALRDAANYLSHYGIYPNDIGPLLSLYFAQADAALPGQNLAAAIDAAAPASGVPLVWGRLFAPTISRRFELGILGRGWSHPWDFRLERDPETCDVTLGIDPFQDGKTCEVHIHTPGGTRRFVPQDVSVIAGPPRFGSITYRGTFGDPGQLILTEQSIGLGISRSYILREPDGTVINFDGFGFPSVLEVKDRNQNKVDLSYEAVNATSFRLKRLVHFNGDQFTLNYNAQGRLSELIDQAGRVTRYDYDAIGEHLIRVTGPDGTTEYTYDTTPGSSQHAIRSVTRQDGTHIFYDYDAQGRLRRLSSDGDAEPVTFAYGDVGEVFITDASNATASLFFDGSGQVLEVRDPLERSARFDYDAEHRLDRLTLPLDTISLFDFDARANLTNLVKPDGNAVSFGYDKAFGVPLVVRDESGHALNYKYDVSGNLKILSHPDGSAEQFTFDGAGNPTQGINRRGTPISYTYDARGQLLRKDHADGSFEAFTYDGRGNLLTATDERGTTTLQYDAADRLTKVTYPNGRLLQYTYDVGERRTRLEDQDGFAVNYSYDAIGRLERLTDASGGLIVSYTYDAIGRLAREDHGNGTFTEYTFDAAGQLTSLVHHVPDGSVSSRFDYAYDALGRRSSVATLEGLTTFGYDAIGQLTLVALPDGRVVQYEYDAAGNRVAVTDNGVPTDYTTNILNQYKQVGPDFKAYDTDGNLICEAVIVSPDCSGGAKYKYDDENRLVGFGDGSVTIQYEYDVLGNRVAKVENGVRTDYLLDPTGLGNVAAEFDGAGNLVSHYVHGFGLVSRHDAGGSAAFYDYDSIGSTVALTGADGSAVNRYSYLPFGEPLTHSETFPNPFEYVGQFGVQRDGSGLDFMRARYYAADNGRFVSEDPIGIGGGLNLYRYAANNPVTQIDPLGLAMSPWELFLDAAFEDAQAAIRATQAAVEAARAEAALANADTVISQIPRAAAADAAAGLGAAEAAGVGAGLGFGAGFGAVAAPVGATCFFANCQGAGEGLGDVAGLLGCLLFPDSCGPSLFPDIDFPAPPGNPADRDRTRQVASRDPNDIVGPAGFGVGRFVTEDSSLLYTIHFENLAAATAPAQTVTVTEQLDPDLDFTTFELVNFGLGASVVEHPAGRNAFTARFDMGTEPNLFLDVTADLNLASGLVTWTFTSLDPATLELPADPLAGFLPPNQTAPEGEGFVAYLVRPKAGLATGARIDAEATIFFDGSPLDTPAIFNTIDAEGPTSSVSPLTAVFNSTNFAVSWSGSDNAGGLTGSGIASFDVFVSDNPGAPGFTPFLLGTTQTSATFTGLDGHTYGFFSVATDNVGHRQPTPTAAQATTIVSVVTVLPISSVAPLPATETSTSFTVSWSGSDVGGPGIASFDVFVSDNTGPFTPFVTGTTQTSATFTGVNGHSYGFFSVAVDTAGHRQPTPTAAQATTRLAQPQAVNGPRVTDLRLTTNRRRVTAAVLAFDKELNRAEAERLSNYQLLAPGKDQRFGTRDDRVLAVRSALYDSAANTVTLTPVKRLKTNRAFRITVQDAVTDLAGNRLDGDANGQAGGAFIGNGGAWTRIAYTDGDGDRVVLRLDLRGDDSSAVDQWLDETAAGLMEVVWGPTITGRRLHLIHTLRGESVLRGTVQTGPGGDGQTVLESITGLARVRNRLPSSFLVGSIASVVDELLERD